MEFVAASEFFDLAVEQAERMASIDVGELTEHIGEIVERQTLDRFDEKESPDGEPWQEWSPAYAAWREGRGQGILVLEGELLDSIHLSATRNTATIGSALEYAGYHQAPSAASRARGAVARPWLGLSTDNEREVQAAVGQFILDEVGL